MQPDAVSVEASPVGRGQWLYWNETFLVDWCIFKLSRVKRGKCCISELFSDKSNTHEFVDLVKELALPGELTQNRSYDFEFMQVEKPYESYTGANVRLR